MNPWKPFVVAVSLGLVASLSACGGETGGGPGGDAGSTEAHEIVDFSLPDLEGSPVQLSSFRGKTVIIDFWATWCPPCIFQVPELNAFWKVHEAGGEVVVIGVAVDVEGAEVVKPWAEEQGVEYPLVIGDEDVARDFGAMGFPTLVIVRPDGSIESRHVGLIEAAELEELVEAAVGVDAT